LHSRSDVDAIKSVLKSNFGFVDDDIKILTTKKETTHQNIVRTFQEFLVDQTSPGDVVYFHYSGHGTEVSDDDDSPFNPIRGESIDGMDASLVPSDYKTQSDGSNNIRGDEISILLDKLAQRHPSSVTLTIDSCYSGTITRGGLTLVRGATYSGPKPKPRAPDGNEKSPSGLLKNGSLESLGYVLLSATNNGELAHENPEGNMGAFTSALAKALAAANNTTTYRDVFQQVESEVKAKIYGQDPQIEGPRDQILMTGLNLPRQAYIPVRVVNGHLLLEYGQLQGLTKGSRFAIYAPGTQDFHDAHPLAEAEISELNPTNSSLSLLPGTNVALEDLNASRAVETTHGFGDTRLKLAMTKDAQSVVKQDVIERMKSIGMADLTSDQNSPWDMLICQGPCPNEMPGAQTTSTTPAGQFFTLERSDGSIVSRYSVDSADDMIVALQREAQWQYVKGLENKNPLIDLRMRLVPVTNVKFINHRAVSADAVRKEVEPSTGGQISLRDGDTVMLELKNVGAEDAYVTVMDLRSDHSIGPLWPHPDIPFGNAEDNKIPNDGNWHRVPFPFVVEIGSPFGQEVFKAVATSEPTDFSPLLSTKTVRGLQSNAGLRGAQKRRGAKEMATPLGSALLLGTLGNNGKARGAGIMEVDASNLQLPVADWGTTSVSFLAIPKAQSQ
jgi:hypothetical protein